MLSYPLIIPRHVTLSLCLYILRHIVCFQTHFYISIRIHNLQASISNGGAGGITNHLRQLYQDAPTLDSNTWAITRIRAYLERPNAQLRVELRYALRRFYDTTAVIQHLIPHQSKMVHTIPPPPSNPPSRPFHGAVTRSLTSSTSSTSTLSSTSHYNASKRGPVDPVGFNHEGVGLGRGSGSTTTIEPSNPNAAKGSGLGLGSGRTLDSDCLVLHIRHNDVHTGNTS